MEGKQQESFYNLTLHQLTAEQVMTFIFSPLSQLAPYDIEQVDRDDVYADCADLFESGDYKMVAVVKK